MTKTLFYALLVLIIWTGFSACENEKRTTNETAELSGSWLFTMDLKKADLPFDVEITLDQTDTSMKIFNGEEVIEIRELSLRNDTLKASFPVFESEFLLHILSNELMKGVWINYYKSDDYQIGVVAERSNKKRFEGEAQSFAKVYDKYEVHFSPNSEAEYPAIGLFEQSEGRLSGTFATETGDYRFLEGAVRGDSLFLSTFDGSHAFYFAAHIQDSLLSGVFLSGIHFEENWIGKVNADFELRDPDSLTFARDSSEIDFELENSQGERISLLDPSFESKVKIIQIMGSWCPNCLDESVYFKELKNKYATQAFEIIAIAFERTKSKEKAIKNIERLKDQKQLNYPILLGGYNLDQHPKDIFPMLNHIMSYPTTLYLDKENRIRKIYTGFYGPGTGELYTNYKKETESFIEQLLAED